MYRQMQRICLASLEGEDCLARMERRGLEGLSEVT